jgi:tetratricopeptide (TPR) repeat protein
LRPLVAVLYLVTIVFAVFIVVSFVNRYGDTTPRTAAERAIMDATAAIKAEPRNAEARIALAKAYMGTGRTEEARRVLRAAAKLDKSNVQIAHLIGMSYLEAEQYEPAIVELLKAAEMKDGFAEQYAAIHADLGECYVEQGDWAKAVKAYEAAVGYVPEAADLVYKLGEAYEGAGRVDDARSAFEGVLKFVPDHAGAATALKRLGASPEGSEK